MIIPTHLFSGFPVMTSPYLPEEEKVWRQFRFPRSGRKRIRRKWAKDLRNWRWEKEKRVYLWDGKILCNPRVASEFRVEIASRTIYNEYFTNITIS